MLINQHFYWSPIQIVVYSRERLVKLLSTMSTKILKEATSINKLSEVVQTWSHRLGVRTLDSHSGNRGSIPLGTTNLKTTTCQRRKSNTLSTLGVQVDSKRI